MKDWFTYDAELVDVVFQSTAVMHDQHPDSVAIRSHGQGLAHLRSSQRLAGAFEMVESAKLRRSETTTPLSVMQYLSRTGTRAVALGNSLEPEVGAQSLPRPRRLRLSLEKTLQARRSTRDFDRTALDARLLSTLCHHAAGVSGQVRVNDDEQGPSTMPGRGYASGGGLYPVSLILACNNIEGIERGLYQYLPLRNRILRNPAQIDSVLAGFSEVPSPDVNEIPLIVLLAVSLPRVLGKYGPRGLRFAWQELGHVAQNISLVGSAIGLGTLDYSSFHDSELDMALGFDGKMRSVSHSLLIGHRA